MDIIVITTPQPDPRIYSNGEADWGMAGEWVQPSKGENRVSRVLRENGKDTTYIYCKTCGWQKPQSYAHTHRQCKVDKHAKEKGIKFTSSNPVVAAIVKKAVAANDKTATNTATTNPIVTPTHPNPP